MNLHCNILHLEDDDNDSLFFQRVLERLAFAGVYRRVSSVQDAIDYLEGSGEFTDRKLYPVPNVIVCDSALSGAKTMGDLMNWMDAQPEYQRLQRIMLTGGMSPGEQERWLSRGVAGVLIKGASLGEFALSVEEVLRRCVD